MTVSDKASKKQPENEQLKFYKQCNINPNIRYVTIEDWVYLLKLNEDSDLNIIHRTTPYDGGYGTCVDEFFKKNFFSEHTAEDLYDYICTLHLTPGYYIDKKRELSELRKALRELGFGV